MHHENISLRAGPTCKDPKSTIPKTTENSSVDEAGERYRLNHAVVVKFQLHMYIQTSFKTVTPLFVD